MDLDQIVVLLVFIGFCVGSYFLIKMANKEIPKENNKSEMNTKVNKDK